LFLAQDLEAGTAKPDADEELEVDWLPFREAFERVARGEWNDGKTAMALLRAQFRLDSVKLR
jgi:ADP-ribose pyrophosphatase